MAYFTGKPRFSFENSAFSPDDLMRFADANLQDVQEEVEGSFIERGSFIPSEEGNPPVGDVYITILNLQVFFRTFFRDIPD